MNGMLYQLNWYLLQLWLAAYLVVPVVFLLVYLFRRMSGREFNIYRKEPYLNRDFDFAAIITAHQDLRLVPALIDSLLKQNYEKFVVYVVADACNEIPFSYDDPRVVVLQPAEDLNSKIRSIDFALNSFVREHDALIIFDSDNVVHHDFIRVINMYFRLGFRAVQGNLQPKNTDTLYARLDSIGDVFYNFTERRMRMELGLASAIWGLGIAIDTKLYRETIYSNFLGGFDKRVQADIVQKVHQVAFAREAVVYDEKTTSGPALRKQRTRWINAYFRYLPLNWQLFRRGIGRRDFRLTFFGFMNLRPPLFLVCGLALLFFVINIFVSEVLALAWLGLILSFAAAFVAIVRINSQDARVVKSLFYLPLFVLQQCGALLKIRRANKSFLKTEHSRVVYIDELLKKA